MFCNVDTQIALAFLKRYSTPLAARGLGERLAVFVKRHGYTGRKPAPKLLARMRGGAGDALASSRWSLADRIVLALVSALEPIVAWISGLAIQIRRSRRTRMERRSARG